MTPNGMKWGRRYVRLIEAMGYMFFWAAVAAWFVILVLGITLGLGVRP